MRTILLFLCLFYLGTQVRASDYADSLETKLLLVDNAQKLKILDQLIPYYFRNHPLKANAKANKLLALATQVKDSLYKIRASRYLGISNARLKSDYEQALIECQKAELRAKKNGFVGELILNHLDQGDIYQQIGKYAKALEYQIEGYHLADSAQKNALIPIALNTMAGSYILLEDFEKADEVLKKSLKFAKIHDFSFTEAETHTMFGNLYEKRFNHELAIKHFQRAQNIYLQGKKDIQIASSLYNIGEAFAAMGSLDSAFSYHLRALAIRNRIKDETGFAESYSKIGHLCIQRKEYQRGINNLKLGLNYAEYVNKNRLMQQCFDYLYQAYLGMGSYKEALKYKNKFEEISELIYAEASERKIEELVNKNEIEKKNLQIDNLKIQQKNKEEQLAAVHKYNITLSILLFITALFAFFFIRNYRDKRKTAKKLQEINHTISKQNEKLTELNNTKDKFFSIIGHDLKGPLNSLTSFSQLLINHTSSLSEEEIRTIAKDLDKSLKNLYELLENLLGWARSQTGRIAFHPENFQIADLLKENVRLLSKAAHNKKIKMELIADDHVTTFADPNSIRTVIRNLLSNAIKFTHADGVISLYVDEWKDYIEIGIRDTGVGMSEEDKQKIFDVGSKHSTLGTNNEKGTGLGLILCKEFVERNQGNISVDSNPGEGTTFKFTLPKEKSSAPTTTEQPQPA